jgi:hypothetical protein
VTAPLRRIHLFTWTFLVAVLGVVLFVSLSVRRSSTPNNPQVVWEQEK